jgi:hypothetical protein
MIRTFTHCIIGILLLLPASGRAQFLGGGNDGYSRADFSSSALPLTILEFSARPADEGVLIYWRTADEMDTERFIVQRSTDGVNFRDYSSQPAAGDAPGQVLSYDAVDRSPRSALVYYRLRTEDFSGLVTYSKVVSVKAARAENPGMAIYPNPGRRGEPIVIQLPERTDAETTVSIYSALGKLISVGRYPSFEGRVEVNLPAAVRPGTYLIRLTAPVWEGRTARLSVVR